MPTIAEPGVVAGAVGEPVEEVEPELRETGCCWNGPQPLNAVAAKRENARQRLVDDRGKGGSPEYCKWCKRSSLCGGQAYDLCVRSDGGSGLAGYRFGRIEKKLTWICGGL